MRKADRTVKILLALLVIGVWGLLLQSVVRPAHAEPAPGDPAKVPSVIKARSVVIVDDEGRDRIVLGAPVPDTKDGKRVSPATGMIILDPKGYERFGVGLMDNGNMGMGFDAPRGTGDDRNTERVHIVADGQGGAMIRFLNRKTGVPGWLRLGDDDKLYLEFLDVLKDKKKIVRRRIGMAGEETIEEPLK